MHAWRLEYESKLLRVDVEFPYLSHLRAPPSVLVMKMRPSAYQAPSSLAKIAPPADESLSKHAGPVRAGIILVRAIGFGDVHPVHAVACPDSADGC